MSDDPLIEKFIYNCKPLIKLKKYRKKLVKIANNDSYPHPFPPFHPNCLKLKKSSIISNSNVLYDALIKLSNEIRSIQSIQNNKIIKSRIDKNIKLIQKNPIKQIFKKAHGFSSQNYCDRITKNNDILIHKPKIPKPNTNSSAINIHTLLLTKKA